MNMSTLQIVLIGCCLVFSAGQNRAWAAVDPALRVVILRHGEKPKAGDNLTCQGENRARKLPAMIARKFGRPDYLYVPTVESRGDRTVHARMFQTVTPLAIRHDLAINSRFSGRETDALAKDVMQKKGLVLLVWNHTAIGQLAQSLGATPPANWRGWDYDTIWVITYPQGRAVLKVEEGGLSPSTVCLDH